MEEISKFTCLTFEGAARKLGISLWRLRYAVESGYVEGPKVVLKRRALFSPAQIERIRLHFEREDSGRRRVHGAGDAGGAAG